MSGTTAPHVVEDLLGVVQLLSDGSVVRGDESVVTPPGATFPDVPGVQWRDVVYDPARGLRVRLYRSPEAKSGRRLPVLLYFHGGGYCIGAHDQPAFHACCQRFAAEVHAIVLCVQYRLAPEHCLPAAIDDAATFFSWLRAQAATDAAAATADPWLAESADFSRTFVSGVSAGANLAHHVVVQISSGQIVLGPAVRVAGCVLFSAFFGSIERVASESHPPAGVSLTVEMLDAAWRMALPLGATRDHPLANPFGHDSPSLEPLPLPPVLLVAPGRDVLYDHAARLKEMGKAVELVEFAEERHGFSVGQRSEATEKLMQILKQFINHGAAGTLNC